MTRYEAESRINDIISSANAYRASVIALREVLFDFAINVGNINLSIQNYIEDGAITSYSEKSYKEIYDSMSASTNLMRSAVGTVSEDANKAIREIVDAYNSSLNKDSKEGPLSYTEINLLDE